MKESVAVEFYLALHANSGKKTNRKAKQCVSQNSVRPKRLKCTSNLYQ